MIPDPRSRSAVAEPAEAAELYRLADASLSAESGQLSIRHDAAIEATLARALARGDGEWLAQLLAAAPSLAVRRHLWRLMAERTARPLDDEAVGVRLFAIPVVIVTGLQDSGARATVPATLSHASRLVECLQEHGALGGNRAFGLASALCTADAIDVVRLPALLRASRSGAPLDIAPAPLDVRPGEAAHLRFCVGSALASRDVELFGARDTGRWGRPLAQALMDELNAPDVSLVALPRPPLPLLAALAQGRLAQRDIAAQLFASRALRELRASVGEPVAVISAHVCAGAPGGGELRLSLSSPLSPRDAQGFRCPLGETERVDDALAMLVDLLRDCRLADVRVLDGVHADRDALTGGPLLFKPDALPPALHAVH